MSIKNSVMFLVPGVLLLTGVLAACGGGGGGGNPVPQPHKVFVTSVSGTGNLSVWLGANGKTGLAAADAVCQARATAAGLSGTFAAWLSDSSDDAYCRIHGLTGKKAGNCGGMLDPTKPAGPWVRTDGAPFAPAADILIANQSPYTPARFYENGLEDTRQLRYITATDSNGVYSGSGGCVDWTDGTSGVISTGRDGYFQATGFRWTGTGNSPCSNVNRLLCMQTGPGPGLGTFAQSGRKVFVSSETGSGNFSAWVSAGTKTGAAAADQVCRTLAGTAGLANPATFKAWVSTSTTSAPDRLTSNGPWVRLDGIKVADSKSALLSQPLFAPINVNENGAYVSEAYVWTGTTSTGGRSVNMCADWTDGASGVNGTTGESLDAGVYWTEHYYLWGCNELFRLYCFEDN